MVEYVEIYCSLVANYLGSKAEVGVMGLMLMEFIKNF